MPETPDLLYRDALPDALRVLVKEFPREAWAQHQNYTDLIAFWLDRHLSFRRLLQILDADAQKMLDGGFDPMAYKRRLAQFAGMLINELHGHHQIEDAHYFPVMAKIDARVSSGFDMLDKDHHALDGLLESMTQRANAVLQAPDDASGFRDAVGGFHGETLAFEPFLNRHLIDEEDLVVPVLLKYAPAEFG